MAYACRLSTSDRPGSSGPNAANAPARALGRHACKVRVEEDVAHRGVVDLRVTTVDLRARGKCFGVLELIRQQTRHVHESFVLVAVRIQRVTIEGATEVADGTRKIARQRRWARQRARRRVVGIGRLQKRSVLHAVTKSAPAAITSQIRRPKSLSRLICMMASRSGYGRRLPTNVHPHRVRANGWLAEEFVGAEIAVRHSR